LMTRYNNDTNHHGLIGLFLFKSVQPFVSRHVTMPKLPGLWLRRVPSRRVCLCADLSKVFLLKGPSATKQAPNTLDCLALGDLGHLISFVRGLEHVPNFFVTLQPLHLIILLLT
jgi:hypothetical protein